MKNEKIKNLKKNTKKYKKEQYIRFISETTIFVKLTNYNKMKNVKISK